VALARDGTDEQKGPAACALGNLASNDDRIRWKMVEAGGITPLVALARDGTDEQKGLAAHALGNLALGVPWGSSHSARRSANDQVAIVRAGGIIPLVAFARDGTDEQKGLAARALGNLAYHADGQVAIERAGGIMPLVALARDGTDEQKGLAACALGNLASDSDDNQVAIAQAGGIMPLVALAHEGTEGTFRAIRALGTLAQYADNYIAEVLLFGRMVLV
tara:strand:- start:50 stop:709 length:660 start_codon:yes stop_codon:yes gene_type:complete